MPVVQISDLSWGGQGLGRIEGKVVFVPFSLPGELVEAELVYCKKDFCQGRLIRVLSPSPDRVEPLCPVYQTCGGCQLQHLEVGRQVQEKERLFIQTLSHALESKEILVYPTLSSLWSYGYRHRLSLRADWIDRGFRFGFFKPRSHELVPIEGCLLANESINDVLGILQKKLQNLNYRDWRPEIEIQVFENPRRGGIVFSSPERLTLSRQRRIIEEISSIVGLNYLVFQGTHSEVEGPLLAPDQDFPKLDLPASQTGLPRDLQLSCFPKVFTQVNQRMNLQVIAYLLSRNLFSPQDLILDLYCGSGNFSLPAAVLVREVIGLENSPLAVANARWNQKINRIFNCTFSQIDAAEGVRRLKKKKTPFTLAILDPPRAGAREIIPLLDDETLKRILYVSCDPMTLFRDLRQLKNMGWRVEWSQPVDFFPQTFHLESLTFLRKD
jgi:23S rRNA (uracil1939-C5)-methyltransferase